MKDFLLLQSMVKKEWKNNKYPTMPNPRWSAASVLIRGLKRQGETETCDRIFIIGGRNRDGFIAAVDVFNLKYNEWETDWKGLDQGELENIPSSMQWLSSIAQIGLWLSSVMQ